MARFNNQEGVWFVYSFETGPYCLIREEDPIEAIKYAARAGYGYIGFWLQSLETIGEAITWWDKNCRHKPKKGEIL